jgi:hypothetical protein
MMSRMRSFFIYAFWAACRQSLATNSSFLEFGSCTIRRKSKTLERRQAHPRVDPEEDLQIFLDTSLEETKQLLARVKAGDQAAIEGISRILEQ